MKKNWVLAGLLVWGCTKKAVEEAPLETEAASATTRWVPVKPPDDASLLEAPAVARAGAEATGELSCTVSARVAQVFVRPGDVVKAQEVMMEVSAPALVEAAATYVHSTERLRMHEGRAKQLGDLKQEGLVSGQQLFEHESQVAQLREAQQKAHATLKVAGVDSAQAESILKTGRVRLLSPVSGVVSEVNVHLGELREPGGKPLAVVVGTAPVHIEARTADRWPEGSKMEFVASDGRVIELRPQALSSVLSPHDGTWLQWYQPADVALSLPDNLWGVVRLQGAKGVWQVPATAVEKVSKKATVMRRRQGVTNEISVVVVVASGASAWVKPLEAQALLAGDEVAENLARFREHGGGAAL